MGATLSGEPAPPLGPVLAAGGVLWRIIDGRRRVAVVHRIRHGDDWTLPKGHLEAGESLREAALREVREETGWSGRPTALVGATAYPTPEGQKRVLFWQMEAEAQVADVDPHEVAEVVWLRDRQAVRRLTYPSEQAVLRWSRRRGGGPSMRLFRSYRNPQSQRLQEAIELAQSSLDCRGAGEDGTRPCWWTQAAGDLVMAQTALMDGEIDRGWGLVNKAYELEVNGFDDDEVSAAAVTLRSEIWSKKFGSWRQAAVLDHLDHVLEPDGRPTVAPLEARRTWLREALRKRNDSYTTDYFNLAILRRYQAILLTIAIVILAGTLLGALFANNRFEEGVDRGWVAIGAALSGALGGITSALQRTTRRSTERIPQRLGSLGASLSRPVIGAIAGISVFLAVRAGVTPQGSTQQVAYLFLLSFGAGFSERFVVKDPREETGSGEGSSPTRAHRPPPRPREERDQRSDAGGAPGNGTTTATAASVGDTGGTETGATAPEETNR